MPRTLASRVARLEGRRPRLCPVCGGGGPGPVVYEVVMAEPAARVETAPTARPPTLCPNCGRAKEFWISFPAPRAGED
ncbi:MAG: hypothetical protein IPJ41_14635 [Phycisphaerales bacterium]|nr:hypothetical protein [Phycisphaerales bacterium]